MPRPIAVIDAETDPFKHGRFPQPFIWGFYDGADFRIFNTTADLVAFLEPLDMVVYAHNGGKFDYHFLLDSLSPFDHISIINGRLAKIKIGCCELRDSYNLMPMALSAYQKDEIDYAIMEEGQRNKPENRKKIINYLRGDCVYLYDLVNGFQEEFGRGLTLAGSAMKYWEKLVCDKTPRSDKEYYDFMGRFYYGGRVECFKKGEIKTGFKVVDINSAYPYAMLNDHPYGLDYDIVRDRKRLKSEPIIEQSFYEIQATTKGCFPFRDKDGSLFFPNDVISRRYFVTGWEFKAAIECNALYGYAVIRRIDFYRCRNFKNYILPFYERRLKAKETGDKKEDIFCKLMMNSLYGKFGANPDNYSNYMVVPPDAVPDMEAAKRGGDIDVDNYFFGGLLGPWALGVGELNEEQKRFYNVATAASITGFVRAFLFRALHGCSGLIYCDTDSIAAEDVGKVDLGSELGQWEIEGEFKYAAVGGKKLYAFEYTSPKIDKKTGKKTFYKIASKGARLTPEQIIDVAQGKEVTYIPEAPTYSVFKAPEFVERKIKMRK